MTPVDSTVRTKSTYIQQGPITPKDSNFTNFIKPKHNNKIVNADLRIVSSREADFTRQHLGIHIRPLNIEKNTLGASKFNLNGLKSKNKQLATQANKDLLPIPEPQNKNMEVYLPKLESSIVPTSMTERAPEDYHFNLNLKN